MTMIKTATPSMTPMMEMTVMMETNVCLGRKQRSTRSNSNGNFDIGGRLKPAPPGDDEGQRRELKRRGIAWFQRAAVLVAPAPGARRATFSSSTTAL